MAHIGPLSEYLREVAIIVLLLSCAVALVVYGLVASAAAVVAVLEPYIYAGLHSV